MKKLLLIDGSSLLHRAFYALPLLSTADGVFTNAVHGFMMMLNRMLAERQPQLVAVCFDKSRVTFRNNIFSEYKGTRAETPVELRGQFELIKQVLDCAGVCWLEMANYEADDLLGTISAHAAQENISVEIFSGDRDIFQLVDDNTTVFLTRKGISELERYDVAQVGEKYGVTPPHLADLKGLMGDSSDNIPGVAGVGEKTAIKLLSVYGDLETLYEHVDEVSGAKLKEKLVTSKEMAFTSRTLATICRTVPLDLRWDDYAYNANADKSALAALYAKLGLRQLMRGLHTANRPAVPTAVMAEEKPWPEQGEEEASAPVLSVDMPEGCCALLLDAEKLIVAQPGQETRVVVADGLPELAAMLADEHIPKYAAEAKEIINYLARNGIMLHGLQDDVTIAAYLLDPSRGDYLLHDLLTENALPAQTETIAQAALLPALAESLRAKLEQTAMSKLYLETELPLVTVLAAMEQCGVRVRGESLSAMSAMLAARIDEYQQEIFRLAGHEFNLNSPKQLGVVLFEEMGVAPLKKTKTGYSTNADVLEELALTQPIARLILDYRLAAKLRSTYTDGLAKLIGDDGKLHTCFKQTVTATGRLSSVEPNLQNIPVRHELGRRIREVFTADQSGDMLLSADYNQIELRVLAHMSGDEKLIQSYLNGEDIHTRTAAEVLGIEPAQVTSEQRRAAKAVNFGIVYGISDYGLSRDLGISRFEAQQYIDKYFARYPDVAAYQRRSVQKARECGYAETLFGRRRYLPDLANRNFNLRSFAERVALNMPIQGSAADIIKQAMINIYREIERRRLQSQMLLQVHDELIFNVPADELDLMRHLVPQMMEQAVSLSVPLTADAKYGPDWYNMKKVE